AAAVADEHGRPTPAPGVLDRRLLARPAARAGTASIQVRELDGSGGPVDGVGEDRHAEAPAHLLGIEPEAVGYDRDLGTALPKVGDQALGVGVERHLPGRGAEQVLVVREQLPLPHQALPAADGARAIELV